MPEHWIADEHLAALVRTARARPAVGEPDVAMLRQAARVRAAAREPGPDVPSVDTTMAGVPVRVYQPGAGVVVVYFHGGGFVLGDLDTHDAQVRRLAVATAATVVAVDYRRAPEHPWPAAVDDAVAVVRRVADGGTPVAVAGDSAGGLVAILTALRLRDEVPLLAQLLVCPNTDPTLRCPSVDDKGRGWLLDADVLRRWVAMWLPDPDIRVSPLANPLVADLRGLPPAVVVTAEHDPLRDEGAAYAMRLRDVGVPVMHRREPGLVHNFLTLRDVSPSAAAAEDRFLRDAAQLLRQRSR
ncbi:alpha/beta hydrolase [Micromonospora sp. 4G55]|uniref:alpha/beta hydrolase n=1 Tax=Micromonospora sp. 4G55 TaxID=2806102 RepID=UPI001A4CA825|nr:alpha/beta hydrolase [Micromonospora sp. 4G55]MBM0258844.1 alpha/beta hydrolase [Micromonospora sp. 4G55]